MSSLYSYTTLSTTDERARVCRPAGRPSRIAWNACAQRRRSTEHDARRRNRRRRRHRREMSNAPIPVGDNNRVFPQKKNWSWGRLKTVVFAPLTISPFFRISLDSYKWRGEGGTGYVSDYIGAVSRGRAETEEKKSLNICTATVIGPGQRKPNEEL